MISPSPPPSFCLGRVSCVCVCGCAQENTLGALAVLACDVRCRTRLFKIHPGLDPVVRIAQLCLQGGTVTLPEVQSGTSAVRLAEWSRSIKMEVLVWGRFVAVLGSERPMQSQLVRKTTRLAAQSAS